MEMLINEYLIALAVGLLVGVIYALFDVRSPAPPVIALVGLLGILLGEQVPPLVKRTLKVETVAFRMQDRIGLDASRQPPQCNDGGDTRHG